MKTAVLFGLLSALAVSAAPASGSAFSAVGSLSVSNAASLVVSEHIVSAPASAFNASVGPGGGLPGAPVLSPETVAKAIEGAHAATDKLPSGTSGTSLNVTQLNTTLTSSDADAGSVANGSVAGSVAGSQAVASGSGSGSDSGDSKTLTGSVDGALSGLQGAIAAMGSNPAEIIQVTASHLFGLTPGLFEGLLRDLLKPWFSSGPKEPLGEEAKQSWRPLAELVAASYCPLDKVQALSCGPACDDIRGRNVTWIAGGGDNHSNPQWYIVDDGARLILSLQGTNFASLLSWANDIDFLPFPPQQAHFPRAKGKVHRGFYSAFTRQVADIDAALQPHLASRREIVVRGHSQGAALGELHTTYLIQKYPEHRVTGQVFAKPRVGDRAWADYVDSVTKGRFEFMQNNADIVGLVPPIEWGFRHPSGEVWIDGTDYYSCPGQENENCLDSQRILGWIPNVVIPIGELQAHIGPYVGVQMGICGVY